ncbi:MAG: Ni/Fe hydrogenase [Beggiatoa sp. IS2]|nr:MAG: Ni/Fe hydrogenase [Beggiatoa sp. IS2]
MLVFGYGNISRGDDALGPMLLHLLETQRFESTTVEYLEDFQLQVEHALDLANRDLVLFIDASVACEAPFSFTRLHPQRDVTYTTHALHPADILYTYQQVTGQSPPPAFLLTVRGESFELGEPLSTAAKTHLQASVAFLQQLSHTVTVAAWHAFLDSPKSTNDS